MKVAVVGSRKYTHYPDFEDVLDKILDSLAVKPNNGFVIISGGARGVDTMAQQYARTRGYDFVLFKPYHLIDPQVDYNPKYFFTRNKQIADNADLVVAFWDGESSGTRHIVEYCQRNRKSYMKVKL